MLSIADSPQKVKLGTSKNNEVHNPSQTDSHYKQMWMHERNRRIEVEQENIRLRKIVYNTNFSVNERIVAIEIADQAKDARHVDEQGRKLFSQKQAVAKTGLSRNTISTSVDILAESGYIKDRETKPLRDKDGKLIKNKKGKPINTIHLDIDQDLYEDFSRAERSIPRKIGEDRKPYTYQCQGCLTEDVTVETDRYLVCKNPNCTKCGQRVLIDTSYKDQLSKEPTTDHFPTEEPISLMHKFCASENPINHDAQNLCIKETEDDSINPPRTSTSSTTAIQEWLEKRRGTDLIIYSTGSLKSADKYLTKSNGYQPDLDAFIAGDIAHIYGSRLRNPQTNTTQVLCFEIDQAEYNDQAPDYLLSLARAGAAPVYWPRQRQRGHLEIYFDQPVDPEAARLWALEICPELGDIPECYPCQDKANNSLSWPLYQRIGGTVYPCQAKYMLPAPHAGGLQECDPTDKEALASLVTVAVTPATLVEEYSARADELHAEQKREQGRESERGVVNGIKPSPITQVKGNRDLVKQVTADFNRTHRIEDMVDIQRGKFCATWRGERTPSVALDRDGERATDYGRNGSFPKKLDAYEVYCLINGIDKKADLAERCAVLRSQQFPQPEQDETLLLQDSSSADNSANRPRLAADPLEAEHEEHSQGAVSGFQNVGSNPPMSKNGYTTGSPCPACACELYRPMAGAPACIRCYPKNGSADLADELYPKRQSKVTFGT